MQELSKLELEARDAYMKSFLHRLEKVKPSLTPHEQRLGERYLSLKEEADRVGKDLDQLQNQIRQAQARFNSLELQFQGITGKAAGILESLLEIEMMNQEEEGLKRMKVESSQDKVQAEPPS